MDRLRMDDDDDALLRTLFGCLLSATVHGRRARPERCPLFFLRYRKRENVAGKQKRYAIRYLSSTRDVIRSTRAVLENEKMAEHQALIAKAREQMVRAAVEKAAREEKEEQARATRVEDEEEKDRAAQEAKEEKEEQARATRVEDEEEKDRAAQEAKEAKSKTSKAAKAKPTKATANVKALFDWIPTIGGDCVLCEGRALMTIEASKNDHTLCGGCYGSVAHSGGACRHHCVSVKKLSTYQEYSCNPGFASNSISKMCSMCGEHVEISRENPMYYCTGCQLQRVCGGCYPRLSKPARIRKANRRYED
jgi:hypothetical protein